MNIYDEFISIKQTTGISDVAAAILVLASAIGNKQLYTENLGHEICMGIRHGLFNGDGNLFEALSQLKTESEDESPHC